MLGASSLRVTGRVRLISACWEGEVIKLAIEEARKLSERGLPADTMSRS